jgi:hypothetical protein
MPAPADFWMVGARGLLLLSYLTVQAVVLVYTGHRLVTLARWRGARRAPPRPALAGDGQPRVTVQLPVYNERRVVARLIDAAAALRYPADRLEIQVLDDSTDETTELARSAAARHRARGIDIHVLHRERREGYKAGALAHGLARARGEILVVFDADFVPEPDFLERIVPHFADPRVGMVQARWQHLNRERSALTSAQAAMLDAHFLLEHPARASHRLFFNFNGSAGAWRRRCIESAGGWQEDTLTEDLDLSYRAQLAGWRFVFDPGVSAPGELPHRWAAIRSQQRRWIRGSVQTALKLLPGILRGPLPRAIKLEAWMHLTGNIAYPVVLALGLLAVPMLLVPPGPWTLPLPVQAALAAAGFVPALLFLGAGQEGRGWRRGLRDVLAALALAAGLSWNNTRAVLEGLRSELGEWERTPKTGDAVARAAAGRATLPSEYRSTASPRGFVELALGLYFTAGVALAWMLGRPWVAPFLLLFAVGLVAVGFGSLRESRRARA